MDSKKIKIKKGFAITMMVFFILFIFSLLFGVYFFYKYKNDSNIDKIKKNESEELLSKISEIYLIQNDEKPAIAIVTDPNVFIDQNFFVDAKEGDVIYMFYIDKKAVLYRPNINKIIDIVSLRNEETDITNNVDNIYIGSDNHSVGVETPY